MDSLVAVSAPLTGNFIKMTWQEHTLQLLFLKTDTQQALQTFCPSWFVSDCVFKSGYVCLIHVPYSRPLITQSILIQSASFSHDCHTLAAAMVTCRGRRENAQSERGTFSFQFFILLHLHKLKITHRDTSTFKFPFLVFGPSEIFVATRNPSVLTIENMQ